MSACCIGLNSMRPKRKRKFINTFTKYLGLNYFKEVKQFNNLYLKYWLINQYNTKICLPPTKIRHSNYKQQQKQKNKSITLASPVIISHKIHFIMKHLIVDYVHMKLKIQSFKIYLWLEINLSCYLYITIANSINIFRRYLFLN